MRVAIYSRVSTDDQDTDNQVSQLRGYAARQDWNVVAVITDVASGSKAVGERAGLAKVFALAHRREVDVVLFWSLDRLSREGVRQTLAYLTRLDNCGVKWHSFTEPYLSSLGVFADAIIGILSALARQERCRISDRTKAGLERARRLGRKPGRPRTAPSKVDQARALRDRGLSFTEVGQQLGLSRVRAWQLCKVS